MDRFYKDVFAMIRQLGSPIFFVTFTIGVNNWSICIKTLKKLYNQYIGANLGIKKDALLSIKELVKIDLITVLVIMNVKWIVFVKY